MSLKKGLKAGINATASDWYYVYKPTIRQRLHEYLDFDESLISEGPDSEIVKCSIRDADVLLSTWGALPLDRELLKLCPNLKIILHAAGSVRGFVTNELIERSVKVSSAVLQNARPVAEFTLGIILSSLKNVFVHDQQAKREKKRAWEIDRAEYNGGYYRTKVGIIGGGTIARILLELLKNFEMKVLITSQSFTAEDEKRYRVRNTTIEEIMATCDVISLHAADIPENFHLINEENMKLLKKGARLINTARGRLINERDLIQKLQEGEITAYLDVTDPEPAEVGHPFYRLPNCFLTPHIAGSVGNEVLRMSAFCLEELKRFLRGRSLQGLVELGELARRA